MARPWQSPRHEETPSQVEYPTLSCPDLGHSLDDCALTALHECVTSKSIDAADMSRHIIRHTTRPPLAHSKNQGRIQPPVTGKNMRIEKAN